ncbi:MAG: DUF4380 domain-containing protein [Ignavibacteriaceae bacterium]
MGGRLNIKFSFLLLAIFIDVVYTQNNQNLLMLSNKNIEVGILPEAGGRIVLLRKPGYKNILKSDEKLWRNSENQKPDISAFSDFKAFNGHITWVGPQSEWWTHQTLNMERNREKADWPPDPYLIYGKNKILGKNDSSVSMIGPESPISGISIYKEISINSSGTVTITSRAKNIRNENVSWDLWMLTRLDGFAKAYVPVKNNGILKLLYSENKRIEITPYQIIKGYFTFNPSIPGGKKTEQVQEVHLYPGNDFIAGFGEEQMLLIRFKKLDKNLIHPQHGLVELYNNVSKDDSDRLLELEVHGAYKTLAPGAAASLTETWEVFPYDGDSSPDEQIKFLNNIVR